MFRLLIVLFFAYFFLVVRADDDDDDDDTVSHITCAPGVDTNPDFNWWNNTNNDNPCKVLQDLLRQCHPTHTIHKMPQSPLKIPDICKAKPTNSTGDTDGADDEDPNKDFNTFVPCCCNTAAYALREACWSCQQGRVDPTDGHRRPTFREYLQCPRSVNNSKKIFKAAHIPQWARVPIDIDSTWNFNQTVKLVKAGNFNMMVMSGSGDNSTKSANSTSPASGMSDKEAMTAAIVGGAFAGLAGVALALAILVCVRRRRRQQQRRMLTEWSDRAEWSQQPPSRTPSGLPAYCPLAAQHAFATNHHPGAFEKLPSPQQSMYFDEPPPARPRPSLGRGKANRMLGSWSSDLAREPHVPRAGATFDPAEEMPYAGEDTLRIKASDPRVSESFNWNRPSMAETRPPTIMSFGNTHSFAV